MKDVIVMQRVEAVADMNEDKITTIMSVKENGKTMFKHNFFI